MIVVFCSFFALFLSLLAFCSEVLYQKFSSIALLAPSKILSLFFFFFFFFFWGGGGVISLSLCSEELYQKKIPRSLCSLGVKYYYCCFFVVFCPSEEPC